MTTVAHLRIANEAGRQRLVGTLAIDVPSGSLIHLEKAADGTYSLVACLVASDPRDDSELSLWSFILPWERDHANNSARRAAEAAGVPADAVSPVNATGESPSGKGRQRGH